MAWIFFQFSIYCIVIQFVLYISILILKYSLFLIVLGITRLQSAILIHYVALRKCKYGIC